MSRKTIVKQLREYKNTLSKDVPIYKMIFLVPELGAGFIVIAI